MRKVVVGAMVSMDGVMQAQGGPEEDPTGGFKFGGWVAPLADVDPVFGAEIGKLFGEPFDLLLGRRTYDIFAAYWPYAEGGSYDDIARAFNRITKYVATRKGSDLTWKGSVALRDAAKDVAKLKQEDGPTLVTRAAPNLYILCSPRTSLTRSARSRSRCCWARASDCLTRAASLAPSR